jgi:hypothetical protein
MTAGADKPGTTRSRVALLTALAWTLLCAQAAAADAPYELNDSVQTAAGPLNSGQSYQATVETSSDRDFYFFHVTSSSPAKVELTVQNLGGQSKASDIDASIFDSMMTPVAAETFIREGEARVLAAELEPQKYFVEVTADEGFGDAYSLTAGGSEGAFGPFSQISGRCERAAAAGEKAESGLQRAKSKLQRATGRLRRSRYAGPKARLEARRAHAAAKRKVLAKRSELRAARRSRQPWCSIAP